jgi:hypothetical protein
VPEPGLLVVFRQPPNAKYVHDGETVTSGTKYLLRTDLIYVQVAPAASGVA